ncbi:hypothetical protein [Halocalculus aciditolerans]|uniref:Uncharacterized protein n=1 Tax=Halocalculus aciditolerans TaxID=1383812 RepID=A0A830FNJ3_9EURY|nr:hypothetical protein [Halocalculus aciditolerans]GGL73350.1 hypothetical protein GCM10009039_34350 [Halocalculus aciditolerans]
MIGVPDDPIAWSLARVEEVTHTVIAVFYLLSSRGATLASTLLLRLVLVLLAAGMLGGVVFSHALARVVGRLPRTDASAAREKADARTSTVLRRGDRAVKAVASARDRVEDATLDLVRSPAWVALVGGVASILVDHPAASTALLAGAVSSVVLLVYQHRGRIDSIKRTRDRFTGALDDAV